MQDYLLRASALEGFNTTVIDLGGDPESLRTAVGIPVNPNLDSWLSYRSFLQLLELSADRLDCPEFGLRLSKHQGISTLGAVGFIMREASTVGQALQELSRYFRYHNQGADVNLQIENDKALLSFTPKMAGLIQQRRQTDLVVGLGMTLLRLLCGKHWLPNAIYFTHARPTDLKPYRELLDCPLHFDSELSMMVFPAATLMSPMSQSDHHLHRILADHLTLVKESFPDSYPEQVKHLIRQALMTGDCSVDRVADYMSITKRTLQRQLREEGFSYRSLLEQVRQDLAMHYLRDSNASVSALADLLGYSELSTFSTAFRKQTGLSPRQWRSQYAH